MLKSCSESFYESLLFHSKISSLCGIQDQLITVQCQEKDSTLSQCISKHEYCSNSNENYLIFLFWLRLFSHYFNTLPQPSSAEQIPTCPGKLEYLHLQEATELLCCILLSVFVLVL